MDWCWIWSVALKNDQYFTEKYLLLTACVVQFSFMWGFCGISFQPNSACAELSSFSVHQKIENKNPKTNGWNTFVWSVSISRYTMTRSILHLRKRNGLLISQDRGVLLRLPRWNATFLHFPTWNPHCFSISKTCYCKRKMLQLNSYTHLYTFFSFVIACGSTSIVKPFHTSGLRSCEPSKKKQSMQADTRCCQKFRFHHKSFWVPRK